MSVVLGIDPGLARVGFGVVEEYADQRIGFLECGILATSKDDSLPERLKVIHTDLTQMMEEHAPAALAMEQVFFGRNSTTAFAVGQACGVVLLTAACHGIPVHTYKPAQIKQALTGSGRADKHQMQQAVTMMLQLSAVPQPDDAADGLAIALCHLYRQRRQQLVQAHAGLVREERTRA